VRNSRIFLLLLTPLAFANPKQRYPLPSTAVVRVTKIGFDEGSADAQFCKGWTLTPAQIRSRFRTYRELGPNEEHDSYAWVACWVEGTITVGGKSYLFKFREGNTVYTNFPDGEPKTLGGAHTGELSAGEK